MVAALRAGAPPLVYNATRRWFVVLPESKETTWVGNPVAIFFANDVGSKRGPGLSAQNERVARRLLLLSKHDVFN